MADKIEFSVGGGDFPVCPEGMQQAVCVDGIDLGEKVEQYMGEQPKVVRKYALVFQTAERDEQGRPFETSIEFTASLGAKASLRKFIGDWRGKALSDDEARTFDITNLVGANALINVEHKVSAKGRTYAKVKNATPLMKGMVKIKPEGYTRGEYWGKRKDEYLAGVLTFKAQGNPAQMARVQEMARASGITPSTPAKPLGAVAHEDLVGAMTSAIESEEDLLPF